MDTAVKREQNKTLNNEKALACIAVIILHCEFPTILGSVVNMFARIGVPLFFMVSGYFAVSGERSRAMTRLREKIVRTFKLVLVYYVLNIIFEIGVKALLLKTVTIGEVVRIITNPSVLLDAIFWNATIIGTGGWFLPALAYCYCITYVLYKNQLMSFAHKCIIPLFLCYFYISRCTDYPVWYARNYLFDGMPFFLLGHYISCKQSQLEVNKYKLYAIFMAGGGIACLERFTGGYDLYVGVIVATIAVFVFAVQNQDYSFGKYYEFVGEKLTLHCYLIHPFVLQLIFYSEDRYNIGGSVYLWLRPVIAVAITLVISQLIYAFIYRLKKYEKR